MGKRMAMSLVILFMLGVMIPAAISSNEVSVEASSDSSTISLPSITLPVTTVTLPPVEVPRAPRPTVTTTLVLPGPTETKIIKVPGPTATKTVVVNKTTTTRATPASPTVTATVTEFTTPRQQPDESGTLEPETTYIPVDIPKLTGIQQLGIGFLAVLFMSGLIVTGMWAGYYLGFKESDAKETGFLKALLNR